MSKCKCPICNREVEEDIAFVAVKRKKREGYVVGRVQKGKKGYEQALTQVYHSSTEASSVAERLNEMFEISDKHALELAEEAM